MTSGLEVLYRSKSNIYELEIFHEKTLRIQSLPQCTSNAAVYLLLDILLIEAELHERQLGLLYSEVIMALLKNS